MNGNGIEIKNIKAGTLYGCNIGIRDRFDSTKAMFCKSLFGLYIEENGLKTYKDKSTRDIICLEFDFGSPSYDEEIKKLNKFIKNAKTKEDENKFKEVLDKVKLSKDKYIKKSRDEIRDEFYENDVSVKYITNNKDGTIKSETVITYRMLYRNSSKAKLGQCMFINKKLYNKSYDWLTMGLGKKMPKDNSKIVELSAYMPLTTSTIEDILPIPVENILILKDQDSLFKTFANIVKAEEYTDDKGNIKKKCIVAQEETVVKNTIWDGMALIEADSLPTWCNGMALLRNHFFKACAFKSYIKKFFIDWCNENSVDYDTYEVEDMFGVKHKIKNIKMITTHNAIKWLKFSDLMGETMQAAYLYWCDRINADNSTFGIVKTDHESKLGNVQQMSYQMINTLPCTKEDVMSIAKTSIEYVELLKCNNDEFEKFLRTNANEINHYEMMADLYDHNHEFANSKWFREEKKKIIHKYVERLRKGKITVDGDNLTGCGNPYALLLYAVGDDYTRDDTLQYAEGTIQCYTTRFEDGEYLCGIRNPHNSPNNVCYLHNTYSDKMLKYFPFSKNIIAINCINSDIQDRANGCDWDSDFFMVTNNSTMVDCAKVCYRDYPTIVNKLNESGLTYNNTKLEYSRMDNKFAKGRTGIGESSNLAQLAMTYYWSDQLNQELYDNFIILSVLAQVIIDGCKREYEVDALAEIVRIKKMNCMQMFKEKDIDGKTFNYRCDLPLFMKYTKEVPTTRNGKEIEYEEIKNNKDKIENRINVSLTCPMNWLQECLDEIKYADKTKSFDTKLFFVKMIGRPNNRQISKIRKLIDEYDNFTKAYMILDNDDVALKEKTEYILGELRKVKINNAITFNRLIETALGLECENNSLNFRKNKNIRYTRKLLNCLYKMDKSMFLLNFA